MHFLLKNTAVLATALLATTVDAASQAYNWKSVRIGGGGGFVPGIVFNPTEKGLAYARTDIGGAYRLNADDTWTPITEFVKHDNWNQWGIDAIATDPVDTNRVYAAAGMYTISWDPLPGVILRSSDKGTTWQTTTLPFKVGGNMPGRGTGERLAVDPNSNNIIFFGTRQQGLWKSTDYGATWAKVPSFTWLGTYFESTENEYSSALLGLAFVTFDSTSSSKGTPTKRIFVGVIDKGLNIFKSEDGGATWAAVAGQPQLGFIPHKGVLSPTDKLLYLTYTNGAGPYDGTNGTLHKYNIGTGAWTDISPTPATASSANGWGGFSIDAQNPGTIMVATLNLWWPDANIWRSKDSGATWSPIWEFTGYPARNKYYSYDISAAPWLQDRTRTDEFIAEIGWMIEALVIDPHDSNHWLYGTGATIYGGRDLTKWDTVHNVTVKSLATGIEETAILGLTSPPGGPPLLSAVGDIGGFYHANLDVAPNQMFQTPSYGTTLDIDYAGNKPSNIVRAGYNAHDKTQPQIALSSDFGVKWNANYAAQPSQVPGKVAYGADADSVVLVPATGDVLVSKTQGAFTAVSGLPAGAAIASDKRDGTVFYGGSAGSFYVSKDKGSTFTKTVALGSATYVNDIAVHPTLAGDVWASTDKGLFHSTDFGSTFTQISGVTESWSIALGAGATASAYPVVYAYLRTPDAVTLHKSEDQGATWYIISDATHGFGNGAGVVVGADSTKYGRVYVGTNGRGIFYGNPAGTIPAPSSTTSAIRTTSAGTPTTTRRVSTSTTLATTTRAVTTSRAATTTVRTSAAVTTTTTRAATTTAASGGPTAGPWGQCGGSGYTGPTACPAGWKCVVNNQWYSQCLQ